MQIIHGGMAAFNALVHGEKPPASSSYFEEQVRGFGRNLIDAGQQHLQTAVGMFNQFNNSDVMRVAKATIRKLRSIFEPNTIRSLWDLADIQTAPPVMQRYIMANTEVRKLFHEQRCEGFSSIVEPYVDYHPDAIGEDHYDYRRVMDGVILESKETPGEWSYTTYFDTLHVADRELELSEQVDIISTWQRVEMLMNAGEDPTSIYGDKL